MVLAIQDPSAKADFTSSHARENAIAAVTKICKYLKDGVPYETILPIWFSWLPVVKDKVEAQYTYGYLCDLIQRCVCVCACVCVCVCVRVWVCVVCGCVGEKFVMADITCCFHHFSQNPYVLGPNNQNVPQILSVFATALCEDALSHNLEVQSRVLTILRHIRVSVRRK